MRKTIDRPSEVQAEHISPECLGENGDIPQFAPSVDRKRRWYYPTECYFEQNEVSAKIISYRFFLKQQLRAKRSRGLVYSSFIILTP